ncbi:hypothetical protein D3C75_763380 [compost metagenome]
MLGYLACQVGAAHIHQHQVVVGAAGNDVEAFGHQGFSQHLGVFDHLLGIGLELRLQRFAEGYGLGCDDMHQRAALGAREYGLVDFLGPGFAGQDHTAAGTAQGLVGSGSDELGMGHRIRVQAGCHQTGDVGHVHHEQGANIIGDLGKSFKVDGPGIRAGAGHDQTGTVLEGRLADLIIINAVGVLIHAVSHEVVQDAGGVGRIAVGQVAAVGQIHAEHGVAGFDGRQVNSQIGLSAGVGLHIHVLSAEQLLGPVAGDVLHNVHMLAAAVITGTGIPFRVLVGQYAAHSLQHRSADEILRSDKFDLIPLAVQFQVHSFQYFRVSLAQIFHGCTLLIWLSGNPLP